MQYVLFVFSGRSGAMALYDYCLRQHIPAEIVNTPRELAASCGISLKTRWQDYQRVDGAATQIGTYVGAYMVRRTLTHSSLVRL